MDTFTRLGNRVILGMSLMRWDTMDHVGDFSPWVAQMVMAITEHKQAFQPTGKQFKENVLWIGQQLEQFIFRCSVITNFGAQQLLVDIHEVKQHVLPMLEGDDKNKNARFLERAFREAVCALKFITLCANQIEAATRLYIKLYANYDSLLFERLLKLKGVPLPKVQKCVQYFVDTTPPAHATTTPSLFAQLFG